jgi:hypothetical protein
MGFLALVPALGFLYIYLSDSRKTGSEVFGEKIYWDNFRPAHGLLYLTFAFYAIKKASFSYIFLLIDIVLGLGLFLHHHFIKNILI